MAFLKEVLETYLMGPMSPLNLPTICVFTLHICSLWDALRKTSLGLFGHVGATNKEILTGGIKLIKVDSDLPYLLNIRKRWTAP
jgi:hypothetical protein